MTHPMCHCKYSRCLKKFCECWTLQKECTFDCECENCGNIAGTYEYNKAMSKYKDTIIQCTCKNSKCIKKYCICFLNNQKCGEKCKCIECKNVDDTLNNASSIIQDAPVTPRASIKKRDIDTPPRPTKTKRPKVQQPDILFNKDGFYLDEIIDSKYWDISLGEYLMNI